MTGTLGRALVSVLLVTAATFIGASGSTDPALADDECAGGVDLDGTCALNALQRKASAGRAKHDADAAADVSMAERLSSISQGLQLAVDAENVSRTELSMTQESEGSCKLVAYTGPKEGAASCFCHKVRNPSCVGRPCTCREGCMGFALAGSESSTFFNRARTSCRGAYLTIPRTYFMDLADARHKCGYGLIGLLTGMLQSGFLAYQGVQAGPVMQCIHLPGHVSVRWLHLHTFCKEGRIDGLPNRATAICEEMHSFADAGRIAREMARQR